MILKGSQRSAGMELAWHLLNPENEHVVLHELRGFTADNLPGAFKEAQAVAHGTRCRQYLFSLSLNPPPQETVSVADFDTAISDIERALGLSGQPRAVVFHEKKGRRHAHCVWSRIDIAQMRAINMPHFKRRLQTLSRQLYRQHSWQMPPGLLDRAERDPLTYDRCEAQQAKRIGRDAKALKAVFRACWAGSDSRAAFSAALQEHGMVLARGERRGFVAVDANGEAFSLSRWTGVRVKDLAARLGDPAQLSDLETAQAQLRNSIYKAPEQPRLPELQQERDAMIAAHRRERQALHGQQTQRRNAAHRALQTLRPTNLKAIWARLTGAYDAQSRAFAAATQAVQHQDAKDWDAVIQRQLRERYRLQTRIDAQNLDAKVHPAPSRPGIDPDQPLIIPSDVDHLTIAERVAKDPAYVLEIINRTKSSFTRTDILRCLSDYTPEISRLSALADQVLNTPNLVQVEWGVTPRYSTQDFLETQDRLIATTVDMASAQTSPVPERIIRTAISDQNIDLQKRFGASLADEQITAIRHILGSAQLACVIGLAGAGKSTMLTAARQAWQASGYNVIGGALAGKAADGLQSVSGIESYTLASLEYRWANGMACLSKKDVLVIDEAGMVGTRQLERVMAKAKRSGAKLILVGDPGQLQPIEAGRPFAQSVDLTPAASLTEIRRQNQIWQREASTALAKGNTAAALNAYATHSCVTTTPDTSDAIARLTEAYMADFEEHGAPGTRLALAHRRKDVHAINQAIRMARTSSSALSSETRLQTDHGPRIIAPTDRIVFTRNDRTIGVKNGSFGTVISVGPDHLSVQLDGQAQQTTTINPAHYTAFDHGYATTIHKSQGVTVDKTFILGSTTMDKHLTYVAMTRHKDEMRLFADERAIERMRRMEKRISKGHDHAQRDYRSLSRER